MEPRILQCIAAFLVAVVIGGYAATREERVAWPVVALMSTLAVWSACLAVRYLCREGPVHDVFFVPYYAAASAIPPLWFVLSARLTHTRWASNRAMAALCIPSLGAFALAASNPLHHLYFATDYPRVQDDVSTGAGPLFWVAASWSYLLVAAGIAVFAASAWRIARRGHAWRAGAIAVFSALPLVAGLAGTLGLLSSANNLTPLSIAISVGMLFALHWRYRLRGTLPVARRDVIEHLADGVVILGDDGRILDVNPAAADIIGLDAEDLHRRPLRKVWAPWESDVSASPDEPSAARAPSVQAFETPGGRYVEATTARIDGDDDGPAGYYVLLRDLTEQRRVERFLRQSQRLETVAGLSAGIAHEINNPLAFMRSNLNHIVELSRALEEQIQERDDGKSDECHELRAVAEECCEGADRIGGIVERMRRFARLDDDELTLIEIDHPIRDALKMARLRDGSGVALDYRADPDLPRVRASHEHLVQLLLNLLSNARQAVETVPRPHIEISALRAEDDVLVCVRDNGPGIPMRLRERIFDPFFTTKAPGEGTGLGLSIAFGIARELGGSLEIASDDGGGASFTLRLPVASC